MERKRLLLIIVVLVLISLTVYTSPRFKDNVGLAPLSKYVSCEYDPETEKCGCPHDNPIKDNCDPDALICGGFDCEVPSLNSPVRCFWAEITGCDIDPLTGQSQQYIATIPSGFPNAGQRVAVNVCTIQGGWSVMIKDPIPSDGEKVGVCIFPNGESYNVPGDGSVRGAAF
jgi:hypothetical protein